MALSKTSGSVLSIGIGSSRPMVASLNCPRNMDSKTALHPESIILWHLKSCNILNWWAFFPSQRNAYLKSRIGILKVEANSDGAIVKFIGLECLQQIHLQMHSSSGPFFAKLTFCCLILLYSTHVLDQVDLSAVLITKIKISILLFDRSAFSLNFIHTQMCGYHKFLGFRCYRRLKMRLILYQALKCG